VCRDRHGRSTRHGRSSRRAASPGKAGFTSRSKGADLPFAPMLTRRAGCHESGSSGSREARRSNPGTAASVVGKRRFRSNPCVLSHANWVKWATRKNLANSLARPSRFKTGVRKCKSCPGGSDHRALRVLKSGGSPVRFVQPGRRGEFPSWRQAEPEG
jgi:hypothetical protein